MDVVLAWSCDNTLSLSKLVGSLGGFDTVFIRFRVFFAKISCYHAEEILRLLVHASGSAQFVLAVWNLPH